MSQKKINLFYLITLLITNNLLFSREMIDHLSNNTLSIMINDENSKLDLIENTNDPIFTNEYKDFILSDIESLDKNKTNGFLKNLFDFYIIQEKFFMLFENFDNKCLIIFDKECLENFINKFDNSRDSIYHKIYVSKTHEKYKKEKDLLMFGLEDLEQFFVK